MTRILISTVLGLGLVLCWPVTATCEPQVDSKAWGKVSATGPPLPASIEAQEAKRTVLDEMVRGLRPLPGASLNSSPAAAPVPSPAFTGTSRPLTGAELAAAEARIRGKLAVAAHPAPMPRWLGPIGPLPPKPREMSTSVPLTGETLARSLAQEIEKLTAPMFAPKAAPAPQISRPNPAVARPQATRTAIPGTPLNPEQRAKLEAARAGAATPATPDRH